MSLEVLQVPQQRLFGAAGVLLQSLKQALSTAIVTNVDTGETAEFVITAVFFITTDENDNITFKARGRNLLTRSNGIFLTSGNVSFTLLAEENVFVEFSTEGPGSIIDVCKVLSWRIKPTLTFEGQASRCPRFLPSLPLQFDSVSRNLCASYPWDYETPTAPQRATPPAQGFSTRQPSPISVRARFYLAHVRAENGEVHS